MDNTGIASCVHQCRIEYHIGDIGERDQRGHGAIGIGEVSKRKRTEKRGGCEAEYEGDKDRGTGGKVAGGGRKYVVAQYP
uniref:Uncharacterized protein n=1 Tax=Oryza punctata TaxID=4537 RepID=A0A0E0KQ50_ORYPU